MTTYSYKQVIVFAISLCLIACNPNDQTVTDKTSAPVEEYFNGTDFYDNVSKSAVSLTKKQVVYDPSYFKIKYPNGDIPSDKGVCCDVVIRAYRKLGIDLQKEVHEDMESNFAEYPHKWGLTKTDKNIDHRRVPNLMKFFARRHAVLPITVDGSDYNYGDIVCWDLGKGITHIGIVIAEKSMDGKRNLIVHNIGGGQVIADCLFTYKIIGHYRFTQGE